ncbi:MAG TPA: dephospho-CoA kinase [Longimicrobiaceae bacterium]|nr:dephospho-CoA kinase [Longimicrobiaceae bacterium]
MLKVGLTGNIAAGKSSVARVWKRLGAGVIDADHLAREVVRPGSPALESIVDEWGPEILAADGTMDRAAMREIIFRDPIARRKLESIIHPAIEALRDREYRAAAARGATIIVADVPLLFEVGMEDQFDYVVLVDAPEPVRLARIIRDRGIDEDEARRMMGAQLPAHEKRARADRIIDNDRGPAELEARSAAVWKELSSHATGGEVHASG